MKEIFLGLSIVLEVIGYLLYLKAIFAGSAKPHRTTRLVILVIANIAAFSLFAQHNYVVLWLASVSVLFSWIIFFLSFKYGMGGWAKTDIACLVIAIFGIILWRVTDNPLLALYAAILADFTGMFPTLLKTYHKPHTEVWYFFFLSGISAICNMFALHTFTFQQYFYPAYLVFINMLMVFLVLRKKLR